MSLVVINDIHLGALNGHFLNLYIFQIFRFCRHMWRCGDHLPTSAYSVCWDGVIWLFWSWSVWMAVSSDFELHLTFQ